MKNEIRSLDVDLDIKPEAVLPRANVSIVKMENVTDWSKGQTALELFNDGSSDWKPKVHIGCDWLIVEPADILIPAGKKASLSLRLNQKVEDMPSPTEQKSFILFDGDGASLKINVLAELRIKKAKPEVDVSLLDLRMNNIHNRCH